MPLTPSRPGQERSSIARPFSRYGLAAAAVVLLALLLRIVYQLGAEPAVHIAGDINDYVRYAWNLGQHGVYSSAPIGSAVPEPDSFRPPGYPMFLLLAMKLAGFAPGWLQIAYALQILASTATVLLTLLLAREWLPSGYSLLAGILMAVWPHHIVFASTLLSETLLGFLVAMALWLAVHAQRKASLAIAVGAGLALGCASLVNSLMLLFPFVIAAALVLKRSRRGAVAILLAALFLPSVWWLASPSIDKSEHTTTHRATMNLIQGSWPVYHAAWRARNQHEGARDLMSQIEAEIALASHDPASAVDQASLRMASDPLGYARWYVLEKPYLLWDWEIRLGWGGVHFLPVETTPMERHPVLRLTNASLRRLNPLLFGLAAIGVLATAVRVTRQEPVSFAELLVSLFLAYVTALHVLLQAEPRYAIPYRPEQMLLACSAFAMLAAWVNRKFRENTTPPRGN